jgi:catechol 2,3-dioxygenase-like lactoylglutathione lyase family enzyme
METKLTSVMVEAKALAVYTGILGFVLKRDTPMGEHRFLTVISPEGHDDVERLLEPFGFPPARTFRRRWSTPEFPRARSPSTTCARSATGSRRRSA